MLGAFSRRSVDRVHKSYAEPGYRADIDGLRAIAILSVVLFHAFPSSLRGGFVGVGVFFVISGYLISGIIFKALQQGDFNFAKFYAHRARRIFPALILVLAGVYVFGWLFLLPGEFALLGKHIASGAGFVLNFVLWTEAGYFDTSSELKPLLHLWSLAIVEQFYLAYPVLIWAAWRMGWNVLSLVIVVGLLSFGANARALADDPIGSFFLPHARIWELLVGSAAACIFFWRTKSCKKRGGRETLVRHDVDATGSSGGANRGDCEKLHGRVRLRADIALSFRAPQRRAISRVACLAASGWRWFSDSGWARCLGQPQGSVPPVDGFHRPHQLPALPVALALAFICASGQWKQSCG